MTKIVKKSFCVKSSTDESDLVKGNVVVNSSDPPFKEGYTRFIMLDAHLIDIMKGIAVFLA